ncbi:hypothetical protein [Actinomadura sp. 3N407]|uniref:hypothetical protein n=1 Tax=Actinomadura sp. 3N407 TaxID=3457423 RepID=UPI003FCED629
MQITPMSVPGTGTLHHARTRGGARIGLLVHHSGDRTLFIYDTHPETTDAWQVGDLDTPALGIELDRDEADQLAQLLHEQPIADRIAALERRLTELGATGDTDRRPR